MRDIVRWVLHWLSALPEVTSHFLEATVYSGNISGKVESGNTTGEVSSGNTTGKVRGV